MLTKGISFCFTNEQRLIVKKVTTVKIWATPIQAAMAIAKQLGIFREGNTVIAGDEFDAMSEAELDEAVKTTTVFARVSPKEKLAIINSLKRDKEVAAMTGDGYFAGAGFGR